MAGARTWANWSGVHRAMPKSWAMPADEDEVVAIVRRARDAGRRLKAVGASHSWSDAALPADGHVSLDQMRGVVRVDAERGRITVQAGMRLRELVRALGERGLSPLILGSITEQSVAGATSTGTHGSSLVHGNLASAITAMRLVTGNGDVLVLGDDAPSSSPPLDAARVAIGALGIVTELTLRATPAFRLEEDVVVTRFELAAAAIPELARSAEYVKVWWLPPSRNVAVYRYTRTEAPETVSAAWETFDEKVLNAHVFDLLVRVAGRFPGITARTNEIVGPAYMGASRRVGAMHRVLPVAMPAVHRETEFAFALDEVAGVMHELRWLLERQRITPSFPVELRFVKADGGWLSPAYGRDTAQLGVYTGESRVLRPLFERFWAIATAHRARPHWGKEHEVTPEYVREVFARAADFVALRNALDPRRVFANAFTERALGV